MGRLTVNPRLVTGSGRSWTNWARTQTCTPTALERPRTEYEIQQIVGRAAQTGGRVKAIGSGHSFTAIGCTDDVMVSLEHLNHVHDVDAEARTITVDGGIALSDLNIALAEAGMAMTNLGDIAYQTVAGAVSTGTHGTGLAFGGLATQLRGLRLITAHGDALDCDAEHHPDIFDAARVGLGALGIITRATIAVEPAFHLQAIEEPRPVDEVLDGWNRLVDEHDHFEFFWIPGTRRVMTKTNRRTLDPRRPLPRHAYLRDKIVGENLAFGAICRVGASRPSWVPRLSKMIAATPGRSEYTDHSYKVFASPRWVRFAEMEYSIPLSEMAVVVRRISQEVKKAGIDLLFPIEVRSAAADDIPLSTSYGRQSAYVAVHRYTGRPYRRYFDLVEAICREHEGRPHWGKLHFQSADTLAPRYPRWNDFLTVRNQLDPKGTFTNAYLDRVLGPVGGR